VNGSLALSKTAGTRAKGCTFCGRFSTGLSNTIGILVLWERRPLPQAPLIFWTRTAPRSAHRSMTSLQPLAQPGK